jgi:hypothetical protein
VNQTRERREIEMAQTGCYNGITHGTHTESRSQESRYMYCREEERLLGKRRYQKEASDLDTRDIATKDLSLDPVHDDEDPVACAEAHAQVSASPENVCDGTAGRNVSREP